MDYSESRYVDSERDVMEKELGLVENQTQTFTDSLRDFSYQLELMRESQEKLKKSWKVIERNSLEIRRLLGLPPPHAPFHPQTETPNLMSAKSQPSLMATPLMTTLAVAGPPDTLRTYVTPPKLNQVRSTPYAYPMLNRMDKEIFILSPGKVSRLQKLLEFAVGERMGDKRDLPPPMKPPDRELLPALVAPAKPLAQAQRSASFVCSQPPGANCSSAIRRGGSPSRHTAAHPKVRQEKLCKKPPNKGSRNRGWADSQVWAFINNFRGVGLEQQERKNKGIKINGFQLIDFRRPMEKIRTEQSPTRFTTGHAKLVAPIPSRRPSRHRLRPTAAILNYPPPWCRVARLSISASQRASIKGPMNGMIFYSKGPRPPIKEQPRHAYYDFEDEINLPCFPPAGTVLIISRVLLLLWPQNKPCFLDSRRMPSKSRPMQLHLAILWCTIRVLKR